MVPPRIKNKVYGKQRRANELDVIAAFGDLSLAPTPSSIWKQPQVLINGQPASKEKRHPRCFLRDDRPEKADRHEKRLPLQPSSTNRETPKGLESDGALGGKDTGSDVENRVPEQLANDENLPAFRKDVPSQPTDAACSDPLDVAHSTGGKKKKRSHDAAKLVKPPSRKSTRLPPPTPSDAYPTSEVAKLTSLPDVDCDIKMFDAQVDLWSKAFNITKVGQGSYAAIFRLRLLTDPDVYTIWKLMPLKPSSGKGSRAQGATSIDEATTELKALIAMSQSTGFVEYRSACILKGQLPEALAKTSAEWDAFHLQDEEGGDYSRLPNDQIWLFVEMTDAGTDLEQLLDGRHHKTDTTVKAAPRDIGTPRPHFSAGETWDIFWGVVQALAHGEEHAEFEHRDLHPGNVCVSNLQGGGLQHDWTRPKFTNLEVTLIDYTLSRARMETGEILANPMRDKSLFRQTSNIESDRAQYDMYRTMRQFVVGGSIGRKAESEKWNDFVPETNILWLYHLLTILLKQTKDSVVSHASSEEVETNDEYGQLAVEMLEFLVEEMSPQRRLMWPWRSAKNLWSEAWFTEGFKAAEAGISVERRGGDPVTSPADS